MKKVYGFFVLTLLLFLLLPIISITQELIYENPVVFVYELPSTESLRGNAERAATSTLDFIVKKLSSKGFSEIIKAVSSKLISTFASLFVGLINEAKTVGWPGDVEIFFLAEGNIINTVNTDEYFLPIIAVQTGDSLTPFILRLKLLWEVILPILYLKKKLPISLGVILIWSFPNDLITFLLLVNIRLSAQFLVQSVPK